MATTDFKVDDFRVSLSDLIDKLDISRFEEKDVVVAADEITGLGGEAQTATADLRVFSVSSQEQLAELRRRLTEVKDWIVANITWDGDNDRMANTLRALVKAIKDVVDCEIASMRMHRAASETFGDVSHSMARIEHQRRLLEDEERKREEAIRQKAEEKRRKKEEEKRRKEEEERLRKEAIRQQAEEKRRKEEEEKRLKEEEERLRREEEERPQRELEEKRLEEEEEKRRMEEEEKRSKEEEKRRLKEEEEKRRREEKEERLREKEEKRLKQEEKKRRKEEEERRLKEEEEKRREEEEEKWRMEEEERRLKEEEEKRLKEEEEKRLKEEEERQLKEEEEKRHKEEEERRLKEEEEKRLKEEEERRLKEEEEKRRKVAEEKRQREEQEKRRKEEEKRQRQEEARRKAAELEAARLAEEERKAAWERMSPFQKYQSFTFEKEVGQFDGGIACVVCGANFDKSSMSCVVVDPIDAELVCEDDEELVSSILRIGQENVTNGRDVKLGQMYVALPHCISRVMRTARQPVIKVMVKQGCWEALQTQDITLQEHKDMRFAQAEVKEFGAIAVVAKFREDFLHLTKRGGKAESTVDHRVTFSAEKRGFEKTEHFTVQLQPIDVATIEEIKEFNPEARGLLASSAIVNIDWQSKEFAKPVTMTLPCHPNPAKAKKAQGRASNPKDENDMLWLVSQDSSGRWQVVNHITIDEPKVDLLQFRLHSPIRRFAVVRTKTHVESKEAQKIAAIIENHLKNRMVDVIVRQRSDDPRAVKLHLAAHGKSDMLLKEMDEEGYRYGQTETRIVHLSESQLLEVGFRGNLKANEGDCTMGLRLIYYAHSTNSLKLSVTERDPYLQKALMLYSGVMQLFKKNKVLPNQASTSVPSDDKDPLWESPISIPKAAKPVSRFVKTEVKIGSSTDPINLEVLRDLARRLGDEWQDLGRFLNLKQARIQDILMKSNVDGEGDEVAKYDMLVSWAKTLPRLENKAELLIAALRKAERIDLAMDIRQLTKD